MDNAIGGDADKQRKAYKPCSNEFSKNYKTIYHRDFHVVFVAKLKTFLHFYVRRLVQRSLSSREMFSLTAVIKSQPTETSLTGEKNRAS